jgi:tetratricopeptide (TPR) repeat protein
MLAERWTQRYQLQAFAKFHASAPTANAADLWSRTDPGELCGMVFAYARLKNTAALESLRAEPVIKNNLPLARNHLIDACRNGPLLAWPRLRLAQLAFLLDDPQQQVQLLAQAQRLAPGNSELLYRVGLLHFYADRRDSARYAWRRSLEINGDWLRQIFLLSERWLGVERTLRDLFPADPRLFYRVADELLAGQNRAADRQLTLKLGLEAMPAFELPPLARFDLAGRMYAAANQFELAIDSWKQAIQLNPLEPRLHQSLAQVFEQKGDLKEAAREAVVAAGLNPRDASLRTYADSLQRAASVQNKLAP